MPRNVIITTAVLFVLMLHPVIIEMRRNGMPFISAFHPLNGAIIGMLAEHLATVRHTTAATNPSPLPLISAIRSRR